MISWILLLDFRLKHSGNTIVLLFLVIWLGVFTNRAQITPQWPLNYSLPKWKMFSFVLSPALWKLNYSWLLGPYRSLIRKNFCDISITRLTIKLLSVQNILPLGLFLHLQNGENISRSCDKIIRDTEGDVLNVVMFNSCSFQFKNNKSLLNIFSSLLKFCFTWYRLCLSS